MPNVLSASHPVTQLIIPTALLGGTPVAPISLKRELWLGEVTWLP